MSHKKHFIVYTKALKQNWRDIYNSAHNPSISFQSKKTETNIWLGDIQLWAYS